MEAASSVWILREDNRTDMQIIYGMSTRSPFVAASHGDVVVVCVKFSSVPCFVSTSSELNFVCLSLCLPH